jgi:hypothetical protein
MACVALQLVEIGHFRVADSVSELVEEEEVGGDRGGCRVEIRSQPRAWRWGIAAGRGSAIDRYGPLF